MLNVPWGLQSTWGASSITIYSTSLLEKYLRSTTVPCLYTAHTRTKDYKNTMGNLHHHATKKQKNEKCPKTLGVFLASEIGYV